MLKETSQNNFDNDLEKKPEPPRISLDDFEQTGCKVFKLTDGEPEENYELTPESVLSR